MKKFTKEELDLYMWRIREKVYDHRVSYIEPMIEKCLNWEEDTGRIDDDCECCCCCLESITKIILSVLSCCIFPWYCIYKSKKHEHINFLINCQNAEIRKKTFIKYIKSCRNGIDKKIPVFTCEYVIPDIPKDLIIKNIADPNIYPLDTEFEDQYYQIYYGVLDGNVSKKTILNIHKLVYDFYQVK